MSTGVPNRLQPPTPLRHRRDARRLTAGQLADLRAAIAGAQSISDDRGYQSFAGIHGLPLPAYCTHNSPLFLSWHRAYLYFFEKALQDVVPGVTLPWWDWTLGEIPPAYARRRVARRVNPLYDSPIQPSGRRRPDEDRTWRQPAAAGELPTPDGLEAMLREGDFTTFQTELEDAHGGVHIWVGGTMGNIAVAAYDPIFWAHHCMIDRCWYLWQLRHHRGGPPENLLDVALPPFPMTVRDTLDVSRLGYDYAAGTTAARGPDHHG
jgi:tyrosinase